jgi:glucosyl-dolichyl phosphate glucuronosyltransferase
MKVTVILCTYNRCGDLAGALNSVAASTVAQTTEFEVLVVDNNSTDQTREVVESFCLRYPNRFRYLFEPRQGKSHALNSGIREARGKVLAFMDDDVIVEPTWLQNLTAALDDGQWVGSGGRILPERTFPVPKWLSRDERYALAPLALFDLGPQAGPLAEPPFGTNMAFQKSMFGKYGGFRTDLGPRPDSEIRNEDTEFGRRLLAAGENLCYEPSAVVYHSVSPDRLKEQYFLRWWFDKSRADVREFGIPPNTGWIVGGIPLYLLPHLAVWILRWIVTMEPSRRFSCKIKAWRKFGEIVECFHCSRGGKLQS